jgi:predicted ABC-type ATPase
MPAPRPIIYLIAGCNGAGKTTFAKEFLPSIGVIRFLNADEIARGLSPLKPEAVAFKAGRLLLSELRELIDQRKTFALESTLSGRTYVNIFEDAKQQGYRIELHFVWIPDAREAIRRVRQRVIEGGHDVPSRRHSATIYPQYRSPFKRLRVIGGQVVSLGQLHAACKVVGGIRHSQYY